MSTIRSSLYQISFISIVTILFSACGASSTPDYAFNTNPQPPQTMPNETTGSIDSPGSTQQIEALVMVSYNASLTNAIPLDNAELNIDNIFIFFQEGSDWSTRGVSRVDFYCCKSGTQENTRFLSETTSPYVVNIDLAQYEPGVVRELYADVFFMDQISPEPFTVNFTITSTSPTPLNTVPTIYGSPDNTLVENEFYSFTPNANDADGDNLTFSITNLPSWANFENNTGTLSGTPSSADIGTTSGIVITVSDGVDSVSLPAFSISVVAVMTSLESATLSWMPPTENRDGSMLTDLAGYNIYYGTAPGAYSTVITVNNPNINSFEINNLTAGYTYYFAVKAYDQSGNYSEFSEVGSITIP